MQSVASSEVALARRSNSHRITMPLQPRDRIPRATGGHETAKLMPSSSPSVWMSTKAICKSAAGTWSSWYVVLQAYIRCDDEANLIAFYRKPASKLLSSTRS